MLKNGIKAVVEGANMPTVPEGAKAFLDAKILYAPSKAANAGGVAVSGLERTQNALHMSWESAEVERQLREIMHRIHSTCVRRGQEGDYVNYVKGANIGGFVKVADAMLSLGVV